MYVKVWSWKQSDTCKKWPTANTALAYFIGHIVSALKICPERE